MDNDAKQRSRNPDQVKMAYTPDTIWRNRDQFMRGRDEIKDFLTKKWAKENGYRLRKELFAFRDNKVRQFNCRRSQLAKSTTNTLPPPDRCAVLVRVARRVWAMVADVWSGGLDFFGQWPDEKKTDERQRCQDLGQRALVQGWR